MIRVFVSYKRLPKIAYQTDQELRGKIRFIKSNHFDIGADKNEFKPEHFLTIKELSFKPLVPTDVARLNAEKKDDLRASHFKVGVGPNYLLSTNQATYTD